MNTLEFPSGLPRQRSVPWLRAVRAVDQRRPSHVVGPLMAAEGGTAVVLGLAALGVIRTSTVQRHL